jgi:hypothetical protein
VARLLCGEAVGPAEDRHGGRLAARPAEDGHHGRQHVNELRQTVNAVRAAAELTPASWGSEVMTGDPIRAAHVRDLRAGLTEALSALNILPPSYTDPTLTEQVTLIRKAHVEELRLRSTRTSGTLSNQSAQSGTRAPAARLDPANRTGGGGVDLLSGNFNRSFGSARLLILASHFAARWL